MEDHQARLCPSSRCSDGALVLGIVLANKSIAYADRRLQLDANLAAQLHAHPVIPEKRFRFASACVQTSCQQWANNKCGVIEEAIEAMTTAQDFPSPALPACTIRRDCRWFAQRGVEACHVCPLVMTDNAPEPYNTAPPAI